RYRRPSRLPRHLDSSSALPPASRLEPEPPLPRRLPSPTLVSMLTSGAPVGEPSTSRPVTAPSFTEEPEPIVSLPVPIVGAPSATATWRGPTDGPTGPWTWTGPR